MHNLLRFPCVVGRMFTLAKYHIFHVMTRIQDEYSLNYSQQGNVINIVKIPPENA